MMKLDTVISHLNEIQNIYIYINNIYQLFQKSEFFMILRNNARILIHDS